MFLEDYGYTFDEVAGLWICGSFTFAIVDYDTATLSYGLSNRASIRFHRVFTKDDYYRLLTGLKDATIREFDGMLS